MYELRKKCNRRVQNFPYGAIRALMVGAFPLGEQAPEKVSWRCPRRLEEESGQLDTQGRAQAHGAEGAGRAMEAAGSHGVNVLSFSVPPLPPL